MKKAILGVLISFGALYYMGQAEKKQRVINELSCENTHLKEELKKVNSDTSHKHCMRNYKP